MNKPDWYTAYTTSTISQEAQERREAAARSIGIKVGAVLGVALGLINLIFFS